MDIHRIKLFMSIALIANGPYLVGGETRPSATTDQGSGPKIYTDTYQFSREDGFVRVLDANKRWEARNMMRYPNQECTDMKIKVNRHKLNTVIVVATLEKKCQNAWEKYSYEPAHQSPWKKEFGELKGVEGGNRIDIDARVAAQYEITIPHSAQLEVVVSNGDIVYTAEREDYPTRLSIRSSSVNYPGSNGSSRPKRDLTLMEWLSGDQREWTEKWDYFWGSNKHPKTVLRTKKGHIQLPASGESANPWHKGLIN